MKTKMMMIAATALVAFGLSSCDAPAPKMEEPSAMEKNAPTLTEAEVNAAQQAWCDALVEIGRRYEAGEDYRAFAEQVIRDAYDYEDGQVFFRPTLAWGDQTFRKTKEGALAYFVGGDDKYPNDGGFALKGWKEVRYDNGSRGADGVMIHGDLGITMGNVYLADKDGAEIYVDKTFVFRKDDQGTVRILLHKSSLPHNP